MALEPIAYLSAFSPKVVEGAVPNERAKGLRLCASLFALGRSEVYQIKQEGSELVAIAKKTPEPFFLKTLVKVMALVTLVLPLLCALGSVIYKKLNPIRIDKDKIAQNTFEQLIQKGNLQSLKAFVASPEFKRIAETGETSIQWALMQLAVTENAEAFKVLFQHERTRLMMKTVKDFETIVNAIQEYFEKLAGKNLSLASSDFSEKIALLFIDGYLELFANEDMDDSDDALEEVKELWTTLPSSRIDNLLWVNGYICSVTTASMLLRYLLVLAKTPNESFIKDHGKEHLERIIERLNSYHISPEDKEGGLRGVCYQCVEIEQEQNDEVHVVLQALRASKHKDLVRELEERARTGILW